jgi:hypothetical protein
MLYSEIIAVCSEIHKKHINTFAAGSKRNYDDRGGGWAIVTALEGVCSVNFIRLFVGTDRYKENPEFVYPEPQFETSNNPVADDKNTDC